MLTHHLSPVIFDQGPQMNNVLCPICKEECYNTWGLIEHMNTRHPKRSPEDQAQLLVATWAEAQQAVAEAEAIIAGHMPVGMVCNG